MNIKIQRNIPGLVALSFSLITALMVGLVSIGGAEADSGSAVRVAESPRPLYLGEPGPGASKFGALEPPSASVLEALPETVTTVLAGVPEYPTREPNSGEGGANPMPGTVGGVASIESAMGTSVIGFAEVNGGLCLFAAGKEYEGAAVGSCPSLDEAAAGRGYVVVPGLSPDRVRIVGVAPNGITEIGIDTGGGGTVDQKVGVVSNLYQADLPPKSSQILGITSSGKVDFRVTAPLDQFGATPGSK